MRETMMSLLLLDLLRLGHTSQPVEEDGARNVKDGIGPEETKVPPAIVVAHVHALQERVRAAHRTVVALLRAGTGATREVTAGHGHVVGQILLTGPVGWSEGDDLVAGTLHGGVGKTRHQEALHNIGQWVDPVHEDPETGEVVGSGEHTAEGEHEDEEEVENTTGDLGGGETGDEQVREGAAQEEEGPDQQEDGDAALVDRVGEVGVSEEACGVIPEDERED